MIPRHPSCRPLGLAFALVLLLGQAPGAAGQDGDPEDDEWVGSCPTSTVACGLYRKAAQDENLAGKNLVLSPWSILSALSMTRAGARGPTAEEMGRVLGADGEPGEFHEILGRLGRRLRRERRGVTLESANALWGRRGMQFEKAFLDLNRRQYGAGLETVDFAGNGEQARRTINAWVEKRTRERIRELLKPPHVTPETVLVLTNAVFFKGSWAYRFERKDTKPGPFRLAGGKTVECPMMRMEEARRPVHREDGLAVLELPYEGKAFSMVLVVPEDPAGLPAIEAALDPERIETWFSAVEEDTVTEVVLPRFSFALPLDLSPLLQELGMKSAFQAGRADFTAMAAQPGLFLSAVVHEAFIEVTEEGTEAAAATSGVVSFGDPPGPFRADRPFLFFIRHVQSGVLLFLGRVQDPTRTGKG